MEHYYQEIEKIIIESVESDYITECMAKEIDNEKFSDTEREKKTIKLLQRIVLKKATDKKEEIMSQDENKCDRCGEDYCDGLKNCNECGEDMNCDDGFLCPTCTMQKWIDEK